MNQPPPHPSHEEFPLGTYLKALATILPAVSVWVFARAFLQPKLEVLWQEARLTGSRLQWLMDVSHFLMNGVMWIWAALMILVAIVECASWGRRLRRSATTSVALFIQTTVLVGLAALATLALLAAPVLSRIR
jgi:hypothetical protein